MAELCYIIGHIDYVIGLERAHVSNTVNWDNPYRTKKNKNCKKKCPKITFLKFLSGEITVFSNILMQVDSAWAAGNELEAQRNSKIANILNKVGMGVGIATYVMVIIWIIVYSAIGVLRARSSLNT